MLKRIYTRSFTVLVPFFTEVNLKSNSLINNAAFKSFEQMELQLSFTSPPTCLIVVYRPPPSTKNRLTFPLFLDEFTFFLERLVCSFGQLLICGDFNLHIDYTSDSAAVKIMDLLSCFNLNVQNIPFPTHKSSHTPDLIITRSDENFVSNFSVHDAFISDHFAVHCNLNIQRAPNPTISVCYRELRAINYWVAVWQSQ